VADIDYSLLDAPRDVPPADPEAYLRAAIAWHFGADMGSPFWLRAARTLDDIFVSSTIAGLGFDAYVDLTCRVAGLPIRRSSMLSCRSPVSGSRRGRGRTA
jgi:hypothetical protein